MPSLEVEWYQFFFGMDSSFMNEHVVQWEKTFIDKGEWCKMMFGIPEGLAVAMNYNRKREESTNQRFTV